jgi:four helix bundle protein
MDGFRKRWQIGTARSVQCWGIVPRPYDIRERAFLYATEIVAFSRKVADRGWPMSRLATQLLKAGTSIGANLEEAAEAQSKRDFIAKNCISLKEARETRYWLRLLAASEPALASDAKPLVAEASEFVAILSTSIKRAPANPGRGRSAQNE